MFAYCGNNPINSTDPNGFSWVSRIIEKITTKVKEHATKVVTICNKPWRDSAQTAADKLAKRNHCFSRQIDACTDSFADVWENAKEQYMLLQMHGSPNALSGDGFSYSLSDAESLKQNDNILLIIMTSCRSGGNNGSSPNMGQVLSTKINPYGFLICSTTTVSGNYDHYTALDGGQWNVYQNGRFLTTIMSDTIKMETVQTQLFRSLLNVFSSQ